MRKDLPDIWKQANLVSNQIRQAVVERFTRLHRYDLGVELIANSRAVVRAVRQAWFERGRMRRQKIQVVSNAIDELKDSMQQAGEMAAFASGREFTAIAREVDILGKQCGGWLKDPEGKGQNGSATPFAGQRAQTLSARDASQCGANS